MREYKREAQVAREQLKDVTKRSAYHDDHLRLIDTWFSQLVDEIALLSNDVPAPDSSSSFKPFESSLFSSDQDLFAEHLKEKSQQIKMAISQIYARYPGSEPNVTKLQDRVAALLAEEKSHASQLQRLTVEKDQLSERLENASIRYMYAEKKVDRMKSQPVAKLEAVARTAPKLDHADTDAADDDTHMANGATDEDLKGADAARRQAVAAREMIAEQLASIEEENKKLTDELTAARTKASSATEEDYASSELYKTLRAQHEDVIKRVNDLHSTHIKLRAEIKALQAERTSYKEDAENDFRTATADSERQVAGLESSLTRIRQGRDEFLNELNVRKSNEVREHESLSQQKEVQDAQESRIVALEAEAERLRSSQTADGVPTDSTSLDPDALQARLQTAENEKAMLSKELESMQAAYSKAHLAANKKYQILVEAEERIAKLNAEKTKADQKYFQVMKTKEVQGTELRTIKAQNAKTSEIVAQLKEAETNCRTLLTQLEKQLAESRDTLSSLTQTHRDLQQKSYEQKVQCERLSTENTNLKKLLTEKDANVHVVVQRSHKSEQETADLKVKCEETQKSLDSWRKKGVGNQGTEFEMLKVCPPSMLTMLAILTKCTQGIATCSVCRNQFKNTALKTCGHVFCEQCIQDRIANRARKCPNCGKAFGTNDLMKVVL